MYMGGNIYSDPFLQKYMQYLSTNKIVPHCSKNLCHVYFVKFISGVFIELKKFKEDFQNIENANYARKSTSS